MSFNGLVCISSEICAEAGLFVYVVAAMDCGCGYWQHKAVWEESACLPPPRENLRILSLKTIALGIFVGLVSLQILVVKL